MTCMYFSDVGPLVVSIGKAVPVLNYVVLTSTLVGGYWSASLPDRFIPGERGPGTRRIGDWVGPRTSLDDMEK
jgi:hypothetical protein